MPYPTRFAGYESPGDLIGDDALTREQKISALKSWRSAVQRLGRTAEGETETRSDLIRDLDQALEDLRRS